GHNKVKKDNNSKKHNIKKISTKSKNANNIFLFFIIAILIFVIIFRVSNKNQSVNINFKDENGMTRIMRDFIDEENKLNKNDIKKLLMQNRDKIDYNIVDNNNRTLLMYAASYGDKEIINEIVKYGNGIDKTDNNGQTALHLAVWHNKYDSVEELIRLNANPNIKDDYSRLPIDIAEFEGYEEIYNFLNNLNLNGAN
uniref:ankyrin repeat domain-containing protein n=1 Tax=Brachyspira sp. TaxID=1977261 RepID=UPI003D7E74A1